MQDVLQWYAGLWMPIKIGVWVLAILLVYAVIKRLVKLAILVTILIILIFALRAVMASVP